MYDDLLNIAERVWRKNAVYGEVPKYIYHGTSSTVASSIMASGLHERSYFSTEPVAQWFAEQKAAEDGSKPVVLCVATSKLKLKDLDKVKRLLPGILSGVKDVRIWRYLHSVPPEAISKTQ